jgi:DNA-directed RNA polymerase specialized sigma24 family protein
VRAAAAAQPAPVRGRRRHRSRAAGSAAARLAGGPALRAGRQADGLLRLASRIVRNLAISEARRFRTVPTGFDDGGPLEPTIGPANLPDTAVRAAFSLCRDKLPARPRAAIDARLQADGAQDDHQLAEALRMRTNTFLQNITRARRLLADCLRRAGIDLDLEMA